MRIARSCRPIKLIQCELTLQTAHTAPVVVVNVLKSIRKNVQRKFTKVDSEITLGMNGLE